MTNPTDDADLMANPTTVICIVGLGPRGLSVLERLRANASGRDLLVHVVDPHVLDGSRVWRVGQAPELLMNTVCSQVTMFADDTVECAGPVVPGPSLYEWARLMALDAVPDTASDSVPAHVRREALALGPDSYPSRTFYGQYLSWVLRHLIATAPAGLTVRPHAEQAVDVTDAADGSQVVTLAGGTRLTGVDAVVLTQGHVEPRVSEEEAALSDYARVRGLCYLAPGNPADADLAVLAAGQPTTLRGLGLTFFDYLTLLTVGRGGTYSREPGRGLTYHRSGREPRLYAGSRRGVPYHARGENQKGPYGRHVPLFLTADVLADLGSRRSPVDFRAEVWPLVDHEVRVTYYSTLVRTRRGAGEAHRFSRDYVALQGAPTPHPGDPLVHKTSDAEIALLADNGVPVEEHWDWKRVARPHPPDGDFAAWLTSYLDEDLRQARAGNVDSPIKAALDVLRDLRNEIRLVVDHGGLSGDSYRDDLQAWYTPLNAFVSIGPPAHRIEEMIALIDSGVLAVTGPGMTVTTDPDTGGWLVGSPTTPGPGATTTALIEARIPEPDLRRTADPLLKTLFTRGACTLHHIPTRDGGHYETGGLAVTRRPYHLLDATHTPHPRRFAFGIPTEAVHWATAAGIRPGANSVILADADSVARASLLAGSRVRTS
ncbi:FAD/NAD(P)-binding protein [Actinokineospora inagensis]|uniref:FAD/NAD(P)-binding protein n=1 Tax=Actinokineospora inagensis TaxID=103730 RepID=UPI00040A7988|nr:FAD/NAD(P)-binding protein [Actinokineospora inagensis]